MDDSGRMRELSAHHEGRSRKRGCSNLGASDDAAPAKKHHSSSPNCSENPVLVDALTNGSGNMAYYCDTTPRINHAMSPSNDNQALGSNVLYNCAGHSQNRVSVDMSSTLSPSRTPSPLFSPASSSTVISSFSARPEDKETPPSALVDDSLFLGQQRNSMQPPAASIMYMEASTNLQPVNAPNTSSAGQIPIYPPIDWNLTSSYGMSDTVMNGQEDGQPLLFEASCTLPTPANKSFDKQPADISSLDEEVQSKIFKEVLLRSRDIYPRYQCGMLEEGPWAPGMLPGEMDPGVSRLENINLSLLRVNKLYHQICSNIFYGQNDFCFDNPDIFRWWTKHIGPQNFSCVRSLTLGLYTGFTHEYDGHGPNPFDLSQEEKWHSVLCWMQNRHHLHYLQIHIIEWDDLRWERRLANKDKAILNQYRDAIIFILQRFRGIEAVDIACDRSRWLSSKEMQQLALLMQQPKKETAVREAREVSLFDLLGLVRRRREEEEERWERRNQRLAYGYQ